MLLVAKYRTWFSQVSSSHLQIFHEQVFFFFSFLSSPSAVLLIQILKSATVIGITSFNFWRYLKQFKILVLIYASHITYKYWTNNSAWWRVNSLFFVSELVLLVFVLNFLGVGRLTWEKFWLHDSIKKEYTTSEAAFRFRLGNYTPQPKQRFNLTRNLTVQQ